MPAVAKGIWPNKFLRKMAHHSRSESNEELLGDVIERLQKLLPLATSNPREWTSKMEELKAEAMQGDSTEDSCNLLCEMAQTLLESAKFEGKVGEAADLYKLALTLRPEEGLTQYFYDRRGGACSVWLRCGNLLCEAGRYAEATEVFRYGLSLDSCHVTETQQYISAMLQSNPGESEADVGAGTSEVAFLGLSNTAPKAGSPGREESLPLLRSRMQTNLGVALELDGKLAEACDAYRAAIKVRPRVASAHKLLGGVLMAQHKWEEAEQVLASAVDLQPEFVEAWTDLGLARRHLRDPEAAAAALKKAAALRPSLVLAQWHLAQAHRDSGAYLAGMEGFATVLELTPTNWAAHVQHGICAVLLRQLPGGHKRAMADLKAAALKAKGGNVQITFALECLLDLPTYSLGDDDGTEDEGEARQACKGATPGASHAGAPRLPIPHEVHMAVQELKQMWVNKTVWNRTVCLHPAAGQAPPRRTRGKSLKKPVNELPSGCGFRIVASSSSSTGGQQVVFRSTDEATSQSVPLPAPRTPRRSLFGPLARYKNSFKA
ncbi:hypothetical protein CYMTET_24329 [Cymbomonas tetramitiformis]|uniref:Uncharacterized protein n=1 Tax=Cymbomonas tetramitiformis TaxID=36881 RepID=A0AAE0L059_9CHLO|nr:hypothetical protein CYMTET_24329 [Cymbomonas tetramitiformis]